jgi:hypothetical protein
MKMKNTDVIKPCHKLGVCPYGSLVEQFPLERKYTEATGKQRCSVFGHQCPFHFVVDMGAKDDGKNIWKELNAELGVE